MILRLVFTVLAMLSLFGNKFTCSFSIVPTTSNSRFITTRIRSLQTYSYFLTSVGRGNRLIQNKNNNGKRFVSNLSATTTSTSSTTSVTRQSEYNSNNKNNDFFGADQTKNPRVYAFKNGVKENNYSNNKNINTKSDNSVVTNKKKRPLTEEELREESLNARIPKTVVRTREEAQRVLAILNSHPEAVFACDTEVANIDVKTQGPVGNGNVICVSIYGGDDIEFGTGSTLWIENAGEAQDVLQEFKAWFENPKFKKVWHNYGFDRHVMENEGIHCKGFHGDTMHMARLWDTSRDKMAAGGGSGEGYSLASLTSSLLGDDPEKRKYFVKIPMKDIFGIAKPKKDGSDSKKKELPDMMTLQTHPEFREKWIEYSARDAYATWWLHHKLVQRLTLMKWIVNHQPLQPIGNMYDFYQEYLKDFGELLTDMEANGIKVDTKHHLCHAETAARTERDRMIQLFTDWATEMCPEAKDINTASTTQIQQLLFGHYEAFELISSERVFTTEKTVAELAQEKQQLLAMNPYALHDTDELKQLLKEKGLKQTGKRDELCQRLLQFDRNPKDAIANFGTASAKKAQVKDLSVTDQLTLLTKQYNKLTMVDLIALCEGRGVSVTPSSTTTTTATNNSESNSDSDSDNHSDTDMKPSKKGKKASSSSNKPKKVVKLKKSDYITAIVAADMALLVTPTPPATADENNQDNHNNYHTTTLASQEMDTSITYKGKTLSELQGLLGARYLDFQPTTNTHHSNSIHHSSMIHTAIQLLEHYDKVHQQYLATDISHLYSLAEQAHLLQQQPEDIHGMDPMTLIRQVTAITVSKEHRPASASEQYTLNFDPYYQPQPSNNNSSKDNDHTMDSHQNMAADIVSNTMSALSSASSSASALKKVREFTIRSIGMTPVEFTGTGLPQVSAPVLRKLAGKNLFNLKKVADQQTDTNSNSNSNNSNSNSNDLYDDSEVVWGTAYAFFGGGEAGAKACRAIGALAAVGTIDATINNFLVPLQSLVDDQQRIHCSLNLNTETGRLSSRRPNLQNQPALEKDNYKIRDAFVAEAGNTLIVADYGQLELRILAHITNCQSMIRAFKEGGCFHSRTAMGMYDYIAKAVESKEVMLEWDYSQGQPTVPLVKDTFAAERRKAKTLNFSIAYGKTVHGLAADWGISKEEAEETLSAWYNDRPEVKEWQQRMQQLAMKKGYVSTMMGRYRRLPDAKLPTQTTTTTTTSSSSFSKKNKNSNNHMDMSDFESDSYGDEDEPSEEDGYKPSSFRKNSNNSNGNAFVNRAAAGHALRAAINTPIQGSAADVVMMAMIKLWKSPVLRAINWKLLLQIHDEVILEGPKEHVEVAMKEVRACMENPFDGRGLAPLSVHLDVDAKSADTWYKAK